jgi:Short C-terminal domain/Bacterial PH domain
MAPDLNFHGLPTGTKEELGLRHEGHRVISSTSACFGSGIIKSQEIDDAGTSILPPKSEIMSIASIVRRYEMATTRSVEWKFTCLADEADTHVRQAMTELGLEPEGSPGAIHGKKKGSFRKGPSADVTIDIAPTTGGSVAVCRATGGGGDLVLSQIHGAMGDDVLDDRGVAEAVERLSKPSRRTARLAIQYLPDLLGGNERVLELGQGKYRRKQGLVVLTNERLFFLDKGVVRETVEEFTVPSISSLLVNKKLTGDTLFVSAPGNKAEITGMTDGQANTIARAFHNLEQTNQVMAATPGLAPSSDADPIAQIERLAGLRDKGIISAEEFESKKTELMGRL